MTDSDLREKMIREISKLKSNEEDVIIVHGGGPFIKEALEMGNISSNFIGGHRQTSKEALRYIEMALKGRVNGEIIKLFNASKIKAVGLSGKDGHFVRAKKRLHEVSENGKKKIYDLGQVGDVDEVDTSFLNMLLKAGYLPVITCIASDKQGQDYNINADMFAGHIAGAMKADRFLVLTDVDGIYLDKNDAGTIQHKLSKKDIDDLKEKEIIAGGMLPKVECCFIALDKGVKEARIINGTKPEQIIAAANNKEIGTRISLS